MELPQADALTLRKVKWVIITKDNFDEEISKLESSGNALVFFALTQDGYKNLSLNMSDIRAYVEQQKAIIGTYEGYYKDSNEALDKANDEITKTINLINESQND